ncbi:MMPL family transporter [Salinibacterium sp. G-O1]|uniref:MMPL family transporter n=1 Tax=Salinibacterium sp. G-O1 TaxID=3046208 RepID=UPI0024BB6CE5|nr:MMPL family transporter [Salinibacterium sp. G-O1]MDJ0336219.1 MMPL family transporter [Salinibacterium sp. G-O1]
MATLLYRLGRFAYRRPWRILGVWLLLIVGVLGGGIALGGQTQESFVIPGTESQDALDRLEAVFPSVAGASATAVVVAPDGSSIVEEKAAIGRLVAAISDVTGVDSALSPFSEYAGNAISSGGDMAIIRVQLVGPSADVTDATIADLKATASVGDSDGLRVEFGGQVFQDNTVGITITEVFGVLFAGVVLIITFGSLLAAGMPLISALIGVGIVMGAIIMLSAFTTVSSSAPLLALMIGLAVGIDYALFILSRHRTQLARGEDPEESAAMSVGTAGSAVVFAGLTVIIALLGLLVVGIPFLSVMGVGAAVAVLIAIGVATTLLPAFLGLAKGRLAPKTGSRAWKRANAEPDTQRSMGMRWVKGVMKHPILATVGVIAILGTLAIPALSLDLNLPDGGSEPAGSTQREAYDLVSEGFGAGYNGPLIVAVDITQTTDILSDLESIADDLRALPDVDFVSQGIPDEGLDTAILQVTPSSAPDAVATKELVQAIRDLGPTIETRYDTPIFVTGSTAIGIDISNRLTNALVPFGLIVVGLSIILLMAVFRSVLVPIKAALGFLLSVVASFGIVVAIFQWGWFSELLHVENPGPILSFMPIILMAVLFGLAMDYEVFLVSGMREEFVKTGDAMHSVSTGFANGARVVTAAALIMFFVFFAFVPEGGGTIKGIALGLAVGIALDAFLVRMTLVPALMTLFGNAAWWMPRWLGRALPMLDIEGEKLREHKHSVDWAAATTAVISLDDLVVGSASHSVGPLTLSVAQGSVVTASGDAMDRRLVAATLAGRLEPLSGRAQVGGHPLPSEAAAVRSIVALADIGGSQRSEESLTVGDLLGERLEMTQPWYRVFTVTSQSQRWLDRVNAALGDSRVTIQRGSTLVGLPQLERAVALASIAIAEQPAVVMLDQLDAFADPRDESAFIQAVCSLASATTVIVIGTPPASRLVRSATFANATGDRAHIDIDLAGPLALPHSRHLSTEGVVR